MNLLLLPTSANVLSAHPKGDNHGISNNHVLQLHTTTDNNYIIQDSMVLKHLHQTLKLSVGDTLKVGIKNGLKGTAVLTALSETHAVLGHITCNTSPPAKLPLTLIMCLPRPKVLRRLIADSVALGVAHIILLHSYRVEKSYWQSPFLTLLDQYMTQGLEQAGDTVYPTLQLEKRFKPFVEDRLPALIQGKTALVAHPYTTELAPVALNQPCVLLVGPEGGFIPYEIDLMCQQGVQAVGLGSRILRTETAISTLIGRLFTG